MDFLTGAFFVVGLRRSQGLVGTGGVESGGRKSHDRAGSFTGSQGAQRPGTAGATAGAMANGGFVEKGPLVGMYLSSKSGFLRGDSGNESAGNPTRCDSIRQ